MARVLTEVAALEDAQAAVEFREEVKRLLRTDSPDVFVLRDLEDLIAIAKVAVAELADHTVSPLGDLENSPVMRLF